MSDDSLCDYLVLSRGQWDADKPPELIQQAIDAFYVWYEQQLAAGRMKPGQRLGTAARRVGREAVTDGPFAESKEVIGGYWFIVARSLDEAAALAAENPCLACGLSYELRPVDPVRASAYQVTNETPSGLRDERAAADRAAASPGREPAVPTLRVARPVADLARSARMYGEGLGLQVLSSFEDHDGFDGVMLGAPGAGYHLEFTRCRHHPVRPSPTAEDLLVLYLPDRGEWLAACERLQAAGFEPVPSFNPYWDRQGRSFGDADGYRTVLQNAAWSAAPEAPR